MKAPLERLIILTFGFALAILILVDILSYRGTIRFGEDEKWVEHTHQVIEKLAVALSLTKDVETSGRGFALTGRESFLAPYKEALAKISETTQELRLLTSDNPIQQENLVILDSLIVHRILWTSQIINDRRQKGLEAAAKDVASGGGKEMMDSIRVQVGRMQNEERRLLKIRDSQSKSAAQTMLVKRSKRISQLHILVG